MLSTCSSSITISIQQLILFSLLYHYTIVIPPVTMEVFGVSAGAWFHARLNIVVLECTAGWIHPRPDNHLTYH